MDDLDDLDILPAPPRRITIAGRQLEIDALRMRQWRPMADALEGSWQNILSGDLGRMLAQEESVYRAICVATEDAVDEGWLRSLYPAQLLRLFRVVVEVNRDFFDQAVMPEVRLLMAAFVPAAPSPGSSPGSPSADTATTSS